MLILSNSFSEFPVNRNTFLLPGLLNSLIILLREWAAHCASILVTSTHGFSPPTFLTSSKTRSVPHMVPGMVLDTWRKSSEHV